MPMLRYRSILPVLLSASLLGGCSASRRAAPDPPLRQGDTVLQQSAAQYRVLLEKLPAGKLPRNFDPKTGQLATSGPGWWCSGFYPGTLLYLFEATKDSILYAEAMRVLPLLEKEQFNTSTHDLGFMMLNSYGNAMRFAPKAEWRQVLLQSARSLATRFNPKVGAIRSWNAKPGEFLVIIDNMMNLELLFWASRESGDPSFRDIAVKHAETTMAHHFRPDFSSYHVLNYDSATGAVLQKRTAQGYSDASAWARGQAWGLYGYTLMYRETRDPRYLRQAQAIADFLLAHPRLPADKIPYWDFDAPNLPDPPRDASAAAIMAAALLELQDYSHATEARRYSEAATAMLRSLMSAGYRAAPGTNGGFLLQHSVGHLPAGSEVDVALTYADYYFVEALLRYRAHAGK
ncbi:MAG: glucuronyl hydrolase [Chitinophagaceae bacterium]|nr:MAG: glucuronyl hydrolase [Chitinophagaceae bacterium]